MHIVASIITFLIVALLTAPRCGAESVAELSEESGLLMRARMSHEPTAVVKQAVLLLDAKLDQDASNRSAWMRLGEALAIGHAKSKHAASAAEAWRQAYHLDSSDCHAGALAAGSTEAGQSEIWTKDLAREHPNCPEALYLSALQAKEGSKARTVLLQQSIAQRESAEALVTLAQELSKSGNLKVATKKYTAALSSTPLFPEDWRPDGWVSVHAHLGLAWIHFSRRQMSLARSEYRKFLDWFIEPGPWHDLSEAEERWHNELDANIFVTSATSR